MKRGLIRWVKETLPPATFEARLAWAREKLAKRDLPALVVYSDVWRSNQARYFTNFMPYWNRSLAVIPREGPPVLLCALSPRVYPWIKSVTLFEEIRPAGKLIPTLIELCAERQWSRVGVLDLPMLPAEFPPALSRKIQAVDVPWLWEPDEGELAMRRRAASLVRFLLAEELPHGAGLTDYQFTGRLERAFRRAGAEDLVILISAGATVPAPARGALLDRDYSVTVALEYCGHWVKVTRAQTGAELEKAFEAAVRNRDSQARFEDLTGPYPSQIANVRDLRTSSIYAVHVEGAHNGRRVFFGDTCYGREPLT